MNFTQKLKAVIAKNNSLVCVGLDSDMSKIPASLAGNQFEFNKAIIDATHDLVCAYKPNTAFYEARGVEGISDLKKTCEHLVSTYPEIPIVLDAKRADIGNTNNGYVEFAYDYLGVDAITLHPYLGREALEPFLDRADKFSFILCRTSNPGSGELQDLEAGGKKLFEIVAEKISKEWNINNNCGLVVGATYPEELGVIRKIVGDIPFLVPGVGAQGGDVEKTVKSGLNSQKSGMLINSSRGIIFASNGSDFAERAREETAKLRDEVNVHRNF